MAWLKLILLFCIATVYCHTLKQSSQSQQELEEYIDRERLKVNPRYRLKYHIAAPVGWINDPNGFSFYKGQYHMFYQYYPYDSVWGPMHWGHVTSEDLVNWVRQPTALLPDEEQCFSGSAVVDGDTMVLMYTAHIVSDTYPFENQTQYLAFSDNGIDFHKYEGNPVIAYSPNLSPDFRDPKAWKHGDHWYVILGSKTDDQHGRVLLYRSKDLLEWKFLTILAESDGELGYMWECPDFFELDGKFVLLMSPQGMEPQGDRYKNLHQTGYIIGSFDYETHKFVQETPFQEIDFGHDFYATQTTEVNGRRLLVGWFGMWEAPHLEDEDGWANALTIIRELKLEDNKILMKPVDEMLTLRGAQILNGEFRVDQYTDLGSAAEVLIEGDFSQNIDLLLEGLDGGWKVWVRWSVESKKVIVERENGDIRQVEWEPSNAAVWRLYLDTSSLELFCGEGEVVFSSRVYPLGSWRITNQSPQILKIDSYVLSQSVFV